MATKQFCDVCNEEIKQGEHIAEFTSLEPNYAWKKNQPYNPTVSKYLLCANCAKDVKNKIAEMLTQVKKNREASKSWNLKT